MNLKNVLNDVVTEKDGESKCPVRISFILGLAAFFAFTLHDVFFLEKFVFMDHVRDWTRSLTEYLGVGGVAVSVKATTEPNP